MPTDPFARRINQKQSTVFYDALDEFEEREGDDVRASKRLQRRWAIQMSRCGPEVTFQELGKYLSRRIKAKLGKPSIQRKTPEQLELLSDEFEKNPGPNAHDIILLMHSTGLSKAQITSWFTVERARPENERELVDTSDLLDITPAAIWRAYNLDPVGYTDSLLTLLRRKKRREKREMKYEVELMRHWTRLREIDPARAEEEEERREELELLGLERERELRKAAKRKRREDREEGGRKQARG